MTTTPTSRRIMHLRSWLLLSLLSLQIHAQVTYYVAPPASGGSDANTGTSPASPFATIQRASNLVNPGDTVIVAAGVYRGFNITRSGTAAAPITFRGTRGGGTGDASWLTLIDTEAPPLFGSPHARINIDSSSHLVIEDFEVTGSADHRVSKAGIRAVTALEDPNGFITVRRCHVHHNGQWGVFTGYVHHITVENNLIHHQTAEHGVYLSNSGDDHVIRSNIIHSNSANGIHLNGDITLGGDGIITNVLVERNTIYNNGGGSTYINASGATVTSPGGGSGINCDGVRNSTIVNNALSDNHASGISLYQIDGGQPSSGNVVANNTVINAANGRWCLNISDGSSGNTIFNNILLNNHPFRGSIIADSASLTGMISDYNIVMDRLDAGAGTGTLAQWRAATGQDAHSISLASGSWPMQFANLAAFDLHLSATSAARNAGTSALNGRSAPQVDRDGLGRPAGGAFDIGAYEYGATAACPADFNGTGGLTVQDLFDFLSAYFTLSPAADFNGLGGITVQDIFDYLNAYFLGC